MTRQVPRGPDDLICPYHKKAMSEVCHTCPKWQKATLQKPQANNYEVWDEWNCSDVWQHRFAMMFIGMQELTVNTVQAARTEMKNSQGWTILAPGFGQSPPALSNGDATKLIDNKG